ncbi:MAG: hypothetical protein B6I24_04515 [Bacteroidetes bacterium 4572_128]|nr:MAG: hypothetical protein B6I24_04515 [Bacteroidetes bacterium 4572_128]
MKKKKSIKNLKTLLQEKRKLQKEIKSTELFVNSAVDFVKSTFNLVKKDKKGKNISSSFSYEEFINEIFIIIIAKLFSKSKKKSKLSLILFGLINGISAVLVQKIIQKLNLK